MARDAKSLIGWAARAVGGILCSAVVCFGLAWHAIGQGAGPAQGDVSKPISPNPPGALQCSEPGIVGAGHLPNLRKALKRGDAIRILSIGASSFAGTRGGRAGADAQLAEILSNAVSGLRVTLVNRGISGELARHAAERIKLEVALEDPVLVLWQVGTADAFARILISDFEATLRTMVRWLKDRNVDVVLVGLQYLREWVRDDYVQAMRRSVRRVTAEEGVVRIGRFEAEEFIARASREGRGQRPDDFALTETGYDCMTGYVVRALAVGLYAKPESAPSGLRKRP